MTSLAIATYNVHGFLGRDQRFDPVRTTRVIRSLDAHVVALQEVTTGPAGGPLRAELALGGSEERP